ncbi:ricin B lectin domain-containing protein [Mycena vitilis]|nr:ricin B lectin domain-containing protein [Mycena vitilis]
MSHVFVSTLVFSAGLQGCIAVESNTDGAPVVIHNCNEDNGDNAVYNWNVSFFDRQNAGPQAIQVHGDKCIDVTGGVNADGTKLQIWTCVEGSKNQQWTSVTDGTFQWSGTNKCIDLTGGAITDGTQLQIWTCTDGSNQKWVGTSDPDNQQCVPAAIIPQQAPYSQKFPGPSTSLVATSLRAVAAPTASQPPRTRSARKLRSSTASTAISTPRSQTATSPGSHLLPRSRAPSRRSRTSASLCPTATRPTA